ncbi:MAG: Rpn family recombination-promoting nuclease/putative transposase [Planctomycetaceae bacterium]|jgi:predicted transposase YdaD|nr:Rpn family recombination-promoting nuclease/putative transposase [Planctomycetaceae bacterium]
MVDEQQRTDIQDDVVAPLDFAEFKKKYQHDAFCKSQLQKVRKARKLLQHLFTAESLELIDLDKLEITSETFVDDELSRSYADVVYRVPLKNCDEVFVVYILIELKTDDDRWTVFQLLRYVVRIWEREYKAALENKELTTSLLPTVVPIIFHHGETRFSSPTELIGLTRTVCGLDEFAVKMRCMLVDVPSVAAGELPEDLELRALYMVLKAVSSKNPQAGLMAVYDTMKPLLHEMEYQQEMRDDLYYALTSASHFSVDDYSRMVNHINDERIMSMTSAIDELYAKGEAKGRVEGRVEGGIKSVLTVLRKRFTIIPQDIENAVSAMTDPIALLSLVSDAVVCESLDEFRNALPRHE